VQETIVQFGRYLRRRYPHSSTAKHYLSDLGIFSRSIGQKAPFQVTAQDVDAFIEQQIATNLANTTINRRLDAIHALFEYLVSNEGQACQNPVIARRHRMKRGSHLPRDATDQDITKLFSVIDDKRDRAMFGLMVGAGLRVGEVTALQVDDVKAPESGQLAKLRVQGKGDKERIVWLIPSLWKQLQEWLKVKPEGECACLFLNQHNRCLSVGGIQYWLKQYCQSVRVAMSCHQLRHTFARRLVEHGLPVDSLAKLMGHEYLQITQRYIDGADPSVKADFEAIMLSLEQQPKQTRKPLSFKIPAVTSSRKPSSEDLAKLRGRLQELPVWMREAYDSYFCWRWPTWRAQTAYQIGINLVGVGKKLGYWLTSHRQVNSWKTLRRADLEAWVKANCEAGKTSKTIQNYLAQFRMILKFLEDRDCVMDPGLFRVKPPKVEGRSLPRYLSEPEYQRLEAVVKKGMRKSHYADCFDRAWFLTLAHTGLRVSEMLDLRLEDLNLETDYMTVRGSKPGRDRVVYLTPDLSQALEEYLKQRPVESEEDHVFLLHGRSPSVRTIQRRLEWYGKKAKVHVSPHRLRHTLATRLINKGMPIHTLRKLLGHQKLSTTQIYAYVYDETVYKQFQEAMSWVGKPHQTKIGKIAHRFNKKISGEKNLTTWCSRHYPTIKLHN